MSDSGSENQTTNPLPTIIGLIAFILLSMSALTGEGWTYWRGVVLSLAFAIFVAVAYDPFYKKMFLAALGILIAAATWCGVYGFMNEGNLKLLVVGTGSFLVGVLIFIDIMVADDKSVSA